jgi:EAL domain-containing protein (putative c-di-GMP-specific phosphodiesterase class I)
LNVASELGVAIAQGRLNLHYQPIVELETGRIIGAEALVRWAHSDRGLLMPAEFLQVAEDSGRIIELGHWVVQAAIAQLRVWCESFPRTPFQLHVNLSPVEVRWPGMAEFIRDALDQHGVDPNRLALEISETGLMTGDVGGMEALLTLKRLGVGVEVDDFGTGYSSISYLRRLPIDTVKVDQSLIRDMANDSQQVTFVSAILRLIESVGLRTVVEGVETEAQRDQLRRLGCVYGQGYFFSEPVPAEVMTALLTQKADPPMG